MHVNMKASTEALSKDQVINGIFSFAWLSVCLCCWRCSLRSQAALRCCTQSEGEFYANYILSIRPTNSISAAPYCPLKLADLLETTFYSLARATTGFAIFADENLSPIKCLQRIPMIKVEALRHDDDNMSCLYCLKAHRILHCVNCSLSRFSITEFYNAAALGAPRRVLQSCI